MMTMIFMMMMTMLMTMMTCHLWLPRHPLAEVQSNLSQPAVRQYADHHDHHDDIVMIMMIIVIAMISMMILFIIVPIHQHDVYHLMMITGACKNRASRFDNLQYYETGRA